MSYTSTLAPSLTLPVFLDNELYKQFIKTHLKAHVPAQVEPEQDLKSFEQFFRAWFSDLYNSNLYMK